jgi:N utilization substance protein A
MSQEIVEAVREIEREKGIESGTLVTALEDALLAAYKKTPGAARHAVVELDERGDFRVFSIELPPDLEERLLDEARERAIDELERIEEETGERNHTLLSDDDLDIDWDEVPDELIDRDDVTPENFGRIAAQTAKQVILQRIREAEREMMYDEYKDRQGEVVTGIVQQAGDRNNVLVDLGKVEALLPRSEQVDGERYEQGSRIKAVITEVRSGTKGPQVILSRRDPELIKTLFELEVPEIADGLVDIRGVAREPGYRSKIAVESHAQGVDPVGACVGPRGSRVRMVVSELRGEKIDIIPWNNEPARFVAKALSPARVREVYLDDDHQEATVVVPDDQLALAIGKEGMNARLAARLTGWKIDITSDTQFAQQEAEAAFGGDGADSEDFSGRCAAILSNGKRCPNEALPGSRYCGLPAHQELAGKEDQLPADAPEETPVATAAEAEELEPVARIEEPAGEELLPADPEAPAREAERAEPDPVPAGVPLEQGSVEEQVETPVDVTGGAGLERTTDTDIVHAPRVEGGVDPGDQRI